MVNVEAVCKKMTHMFVLQLDRFLRLSLPLPGFLIADGAFGNADIVTLLKLYKSFLFCIGVVMMM